MPNRTRRYVAAVALVVIATVVRLLLDSSLGEKAAYATYFAAVIIAAWYGGLGSALLTLILGAAAAAYFFIPPRGSIFFLGNVASQIRLAFYLGLGLAIAWLIDSLRVARRRADERHEWLRVTMSSIADAVIATDKEGRVSFLNRRAAVLTGWTAEEAAGQPLEAVFRLSDGQTRRPISYPISRVLREGALGELPNHILLMAREERTRPIAQSAAPVRDGHGVLLGVVLVFRDITEQRGIEDTHRASEQRLRSLAETLPAMVWATRPDGWTEYVNQRWMDYSGLTLEQSQGAGWAEALHHDDRQRCLDRWQRSLAVGKVFEMEYRFRDQRGDYRWFFGRAMPIYDAAGRVTQWLGTALDIDDRKRAEEAVWEREERLRQFTESDIIGINFADVHGRIIFANDAYLRLVGYTREDLQAGRVRWDNLTPPEWLSTDARAIAEAKALGTCTPYEKEYVRRDGSRVPVLVGFVLLGEAREEAIAYILDLTELKQVEWEAQQARVAAEAANRAKDHFLAALSHELRTPLTPSLLATSALEADPRLHPDLRDDVHLVRRNIEMEARLIDDLLDITRTAQGKIDLKSETVDVHSLVHHAVHICRADITGKQLRLTLALEAQRSCVRGDGARLQQVLWNLVKNSVKFTPEGESITISTVAAADGWLVIRVTDTGIGIAPEVLPHIFAAFEQGGRETTQRYGGLGLGLAISKALVEAHNGTIRAVSGGPGKGTTVTVELPGAEYPSKVADKTRNGDDEVGPCRPLRVLLVEDDTDTLRVLSRLLRTAGHDVTTAETVASALAAAGAHSFDLLVSDLGLPDGSGLELMGRLRPLPGIALTGYGMEIDIQQAHEAGYSCHLTKPIDPARLHTEMQRITGDEAHRMVPRSIKTGLAVSTVGRER